MMLIKRPLELKGKLLTGEYIAKESLEQLQWNKKGGQRRERQILYDFAYMWNQKQKVKIHTGLNIYYVVK